MENSKFVLLDNVEHHDLRVITGHSAAFGDAINQVLIFPNEFAEIQREYPIFFRRKEEGTFQAIALLGFDRDENLFLADNGWNAGYIPALQDRGPFSIGFREDEGLDGTTPPTPMILFDAENARLSRTEGEALFLTHGGNSPQLERYTQSLRTIHQGAGANDAAFAAFLEAGILAPVNVNIKIDDRLEYNIPDLFSISGEALAALDGPTLERLNQGGFLALAFHVVASIGSIRRLIELKTRKRREA